MLFEVYKITWTNVDQLAVKSCGIHLVAISQEMVNRIDMSFKRYYFMIIEESPRRQ